ncbi:MAG: redoxin domain-containing protein [candidate division Zixibacteria bacterium]|nr:redoxin domain-containing protein [candidate division Zixibacteria bacterium]
MKHYLLPLLISLVLLSCGKQRQPIANLYTEPAELTALNDSVETYAAVTEEFKFEDFLSIYQHFLKANPNSTPLHRELQDLFDGFDRGDEKIEYYRELQAENPTSAMYAYLYGRALTGDSAMPMFTRAIELDSNFFFGHFGMAYSYLTASPPDTAAAVAEYHKCLKIDSSFPRTHRQLANIYLAQDNYADALWAAEGMAITTPAEYVPVSFKAMILKEKGDLNGAERELIGFARANPDHSRVRSDLIELYEEAERWQDALKYRHQMVELARDTVEATFELARTYLSLGEPDSALTYVSRAVAQGFADYRRLTKSPTLESIRSLDGYIDVVVQLKENLEQQRQTRMAERIEGVEERKEMALAKKLDLKAPQFSLVNLDGRTVSLADLQGKVVVLDFWATWCAPCLIGMPLLHEFIDQKPDGVEFFSVNVWERDTSRVRPFLDNYGYSFNILFGDEELAKQYQISGIPTLFVIDKDGVIRYRHVGYSPFADETLKWQTETLL